MKVGDLVRHRSSGNICLVLDVKKSENSVLVEDSVLVVHCFGEMKHKGWYGTSYFIKV